MTTSDAVFNTLKISGNLPSMPQILVQLIDKCHEPEIDLQAIVRIVDKDAAISAKLLQLVNSAFIGARRPFTNLEQAVVYLGSDTIRNLAISLSVQQVFRRVENNSLLSVDRFWHHSFLTALLARNIAVATGYPDPAEAYLTGLLHDIGKLLLWMAFPGKYAPLLLKGVRCHNGRLAFLEEEKLHVNHCSAGAWLCEQWHLPTLLADAIRYHHHPLEEVEQALPLTRIACLADLLSHSSTGGRDCLDAAGRLFDLSGEQVSALYEGVEERIGELADLLGIHVPRSAKSSHDQEPESQEIHKETSLGLISRVREITQMSGLLDNLLRAENTIQVAAAVEQGLRILFNEEACLMMVLDGHGGELRGVASPDNRLAGEMDGLAFSPQRYARSLPGRAIRAGRLLHSFGKKTDGKRAASLLDTQLLHLLGTEGMVAIPMVCRQETLGLLLIGLGEAAFHRFNGQWTPLRLLANHAAICLSMERMRTAQAEQIVAERIQAATLAARKIAHEINNPLATLRNYTRILGKKSEQGEPIGDELAILDNELERLGHITLGLEDLAQEHDEIRPEPLDLHRLIAETLQLFRTASGTTSRVDFTYVPWPDPLPIRTDRHCLSQILQNLLGNAVDAVAGQGHVTVRTTAEVSGTVLMTVEDDGPGIDPGLGAILFTAGTSTKGGRHGGLGLAIVHRLTTRMGGTINYRSQPGQTVFTLALPA
ncbi:HDOD domain-containing protein [Desulfobulbus elongatus]|uniref:HDOD domain-containing protein n=1 Tax=Desulfobulbus elongatus TaxID=53332 RepID=UPI0004823213|nr:HDOD domain-containing protein [Desulfobulbus elongatus]